MNLKWITIWFLLFPALLQGQPYQISLEQVLNEWCLMSPSAQKIKLSHENSILEFENYKKEFLPSVAFSLSPVNFNRSQKLMQNSESGNYSYVEDYSNNSSTEIAIRQKSVSSEASSVSVHDSTTSGNSPITEIVLELIHFTSTIRNPSSEVSIITRGKEVYSMQYIITH